MSAETLLKALSLTGKSGHRKIDKRNWSAEIVDTFILILAVLPLLITAHLPLVDLPNHLARQYILRDLANSPGLQIYYEVHWALVPNLALEIFVGAARYVMSIDAAVRAFCIVTMVMLFVGTRRINLDFGGSESRIYRVAPVLFYGAPFQYGFLSFCFGVGLALIVFALYLDLRRQTESWFKLGIIFAPCALALLLCHLVAFGVFAIAVGSAELDKAYLDAGGWNRRLLICVLKRQLRIASFLLPVFFLFEYLSPVADSASVRFSSLHQKAEGIAALTLFSSPVTELPLLILVGCVLMGALASNFVRPKRSTIIMATVFAIVWLVLPRTMMGAGYIDLRIPWAGSFFLLAGLVPSASYERLAGRFGAFASVLVLTRIVLIAFFWISWESTLANIDNALRQLPVGARLMVVMGDLESVSESRRPGLDHVAAYSVARRQAFEPNLFASISGQILYFRKPYNELKTFPAPTSLKNLSPHYNFLLVLHPEVAQISPGLPLRCLRSGAQFALLQVQSSAQRSGSNAPCLR